MQTESDNESFDVIPMPLNKELLNAIHKHTFHAKIDNPICSDEQKMDNIVDIITILNDVSKKLGDMCIDSKLLKDSIHNNTVTKETVVKLYNSLCNSVGPVGPISPISPVGPVGITKLNVIFNTKQYGNFTIKSSFSSCSDTSGRYFITRQNLFDDEKNKFHSSTIYLGYSKYIITDENNIWNFAIDSNKVYDVYLKNEHCMNKFIEFLLVLSNVFMKELCINDTKDSMFTTKDSIYVYNENLVSPPQCSINFRLVEKKREGFNLITFDDKLTLRIN